MTAKLIATLIMRVASGNSVRRAMARGGMLAAALVPATAPANSSFDKVFATAGEPRQLRFTVLYRNADGIHRLAVWRDGQRRLKRVTDGQVTTLVHRSRYGPDFSMQVLDPRRHTSTHVDRNSLYRVGQFTEWFDLAHGLRHPVNAYRLTARTALSPMPRVPASCRWYDLVAQGRATSICWDAADKVPLLIATGPSRPIWRVLSIDRGPIAPDTFAPNDRGYIHDDATRDISND